VNQFAISKILGSKIKEVESVGFGGFVSLRAKRWRGVSIETWERKLIHDLNPVFNWPMPQDAA
jgi:hypothetical protein